MEELIIKIDNEEITYDTHYMYSDMIDVEIEEDIAYIIFKRTHLSIDINEMIFEINNKLIRKILSGKFTDVCLSYTKKDGDIKNIKVEPFLINSKKIIFTAKIFQK